MSDSYRYEVRSFIAERFPHSDLSDDEDIFDLGFVNSLFAMELVMFIEDTYGVTIPNGELTRENFATIQSIAELIGRQLSGAARVSA